MQELKSETEVQAPTRQTRFGPRQPPFCGVKSSTQDCLSPRPQFASVSISSFPVRVRLAF
jgi:hypothetical protein